MSKDAEKFYCSSVMPNLNSWKRNRPHEIECDIYIGDLNAQTGTFASQIHKRRIIGTHHIPSDIEVTRYIEQPNTVYWQITFAAKSRSTKPEPETLAPQSSKKPYNH